MEKTKIEKFKIERIIPQRVECIEYDYKRLVEEKEGLQIRLKEIEELLEIANKEAKKGVKEYKITTENVL